MGKPGFHVRKKLEKQLQRPPSSSSRKPQWYHHSTRTSAWMPSSAPGSNAHRGAGPAQPARTPRARSQDLIGPSLPPGKKKEFVFRTQGGRIRFDKAEGEDRKSVV